MIADLPPTTDLGAIRSVDYARFASRFSHVLELRPMDYSKYPVFAFAFVRVPTDDPSELDRILGEDPTAYLDRGGDRL